MTSCTKKIWLVTFTYNRDTQKISQQRFAAYDLEELLSFLTKDAIKKISRIENLEEDVTYLY